MKIPETSANIGAYYGNEENNQWQPNGVIVDNGVGSGDALHRPPVYPVHIPRGHIPGYVMAGAYYPPAAFPPVPAPPQDDFEDYMWMENEEEFDKQVMQQLEEEALMEQCIEAMLEDEQRERHRPVSNGHNHHYPTTSNGQPSLSLEEAVSRSTLNPLAAEFVPTRAIQPPADGERKTAEETRTEESQSAKTEEVASRQETEECKEVKQVKQESKTEEPTTVPSETPEVSAADVQPAVERKPRDAKRDAKKAPKQEPKPKPKPAAPKQEPKAAPKRKEQKPVKAETKEVVQEKAVDEAPPADVVKQATPPVEEPKEGPKPINYAAAAKASRARKPREGSPPALEKKTEKRVQRKNSAK